MYFTNYFLVESLYLWLIWVRCPGKVLLLVVCLFYYNGLVVFVFLIRIELAKYSVFPFSDIFQFKSC
jgi:hypothetical protein